MNSDSDTCAAEPPGAVSAADEEDQSFSETYHVESHHSATIVTLAAGLSSTQVDTVSRTADGTLSVTDDDTLTLTPSAAGETAEDVSHEHDHDHETAHEVDTRTLNSLTTTTPSEGTTVVTTLHDDYTVTSDESDDFDDTSDDDDEAGAAGPASETADETDTADETFDVTRVSHHDVTVDTSSALSHSVQVDHELRSVTSDETLHESEGFEEDPVEGGEVAGETDADSDTALITQHTVRWGTFNATLVTPATSTTPATTALEADDYSATFDGSETTTATDAETVAGNGATAGSVTDDYAGHDSGSDTVTASAHYTRTVTTDLGSGQYAIVTDSLTLGETGSDSYSDAGGEEVVPWTQGGTLPPGFIAEVFSTGANGDPTIAAETTGQHDRTSDIIESWSRGHTETAPDAQGVIQTTSNTTTGTDEKTETTHQTLLNGAGDPTDTTTETGTPAPGWSTPPDINFETVQSWNAVTTPPTQITLDTASNSWSVGYRNLLARHQGLAAADQIAAQIPGMQRPAVIIPAAQPIHVQGLLTTFPKPATDFKQISGPSATVPPLMRLSADGEIGLIELGPPAPPTIEDAVGQPFGPVWKQYNARAKLANEMSATIAGWVQTLFPPRNPGQIDFFDAAVQDLTGFLAPIASATAVSLAALGDVRQAPVLLAFMVGQNLYQNTMSTISNVANLPWYQRAPVVVGNLVGTFFGIPLIADAQSGKDAAGNRLTWGARVLRGVEGTVFAYLSVVGLRNFFRGAPEGAIVEEGAAGESQLLRRPDQLLAEQEALESSVISRMTAEEFRELMNRTLSEPPFKGGQRIDGIELRNRLDAISKKFNVDADTETELLGTRDRGYHQIVEETLASGGKIYHNKMRVRPGATEFEFLHEELHTVQAEEMGRAKYFGLSELEREQAVFDALIKHDKWASFTDLEKQFAVDYLYWRFKGDVRGFAPSATNPFLQ